MSISYQSVGRLSTAQTVAYTASSAAISTAVGTQTYRVLVSSTTACHIRTAVSPTAVATDTLLPAFGQPIVISINPGEKVAAIQDTAGGTLSVTELT